MRQRSSHFDRVTAVERSGWKILHLQVAGIGPVVLAPGYAGLYACFWHNAVPLGHVELLPGELPLSSSQARDVAARAIAPALHAYTSCAAVGPAVPESPLQTLEGSWTPGGGSFARDTAVVICTRNQAPQLDRCLQSVCSLTSKPAEIIVVDNTAGDLATERVVGDYTGVRYVVEPQLGVSRARNVGVTHSSCPVVAFIDADTVVTPEWLSELTEAFVDRDVDAVSGVVFPAELQTHAQLIFERDVLGLQRSYAPRIYRRDFLVSAGKYAAPVWNICAGGNMAVRRAAFERVGLFDERLGAGAAGAGEDFELWHRILTGGGACAYLPAAVVHHHLPISSEMLGEQFYLCMRGHVTALLAQFATSGDRRSISRVLFELPVMGVESLVRWLLHPEANHRGMLRGFLGCAAGVAYWLRQPRAR